MPVWELAAFKRTIGGCEELRALRNTGARAVSGLDAVTIQWRLHEHQVTGNKEKRRPLESRISSRYAEDSELLHWQAVTELEMDGNDSHDMRRVR